MKAGYVNFANLIQAIPSARCEETTGGFQRKIPQEDGTIVVIEEYLRCGAPATMVVLSERGRHLYFMCSGCGTHNVDNRGAVFIATTDRLVELRYVGVEHD